MYARPLALAIIMFAATSATAKADDYVIILKDKKFAPAELVIPARQKVDIVVRNQDAVEAEFESGDLDREKVVGAGQQATVHVGPLDSGTYTYKNDFHEETTGVIVVK